MVKSRAYAGYPLSATCYLLSATAICHLSSGNLPSAIRDIVILSETLASPKRRPRRFKAAFIFLNTYLNGGSETAEWLGELFEELAATIFDAREALNLHQ